MKLNRKEFLSMLAMHQNNIDKRAINQIFASIRVYSNANELNIISMDGERLLQHKVNEQFQKCDLFLPGASLYDLLRKSTQEYFEILESDQENKEQNYIVKLGNGEFKFAKNKEAKFPEWIDSHEHTIEFDAKELSDNLKTVKWASSTDDSRPFLNGVCLDLTSDKVNFCSTDGLRLALSKLNNTTGIEGTWIFSRKSVNDLIKLLEEAEGKVFVSLGKNVQIKFSTKNKEITWKSLLVAGKFPQYEKIITKDYIGKLKVEVKDLIEIIDRMMIIANFNQPIITFTLGYQCEVFAESSTSSGKDILKCEYEGPDFKISFNGKLLLEMLNNISGKIDILINNPLAPVAIKSEINENAIFILAPMKR